MSTDKIQKFREILKNVVSLRIFVSCVQARCYYANRKRLTANTSIDYREVVTEKNAVPTSFAKPQD